MKLKNFLGKFLLEGLVSTFILYSLEILTILIVGFRSVPSPAFVLKYPGFGKENKIELYMFMRYVILSYVM